ncbi:MAG: hypothetical protein JXA42_26055, partial [Anaerolineales bacterium]|nr:hypothetical protein [Anaerolineales bacterium]
MKRSFFWISILLIILVLTGLACNIGGAEEPTATPIPPTNTPVPNTATPVPEPTLEPTATPEEVEEPTEAPAEPQETDEEETPVDGIIQVENETFGIRMSYPEEWYYDDSFFILLSSEPGVDPLSAEEMPNALVIIALAGAAEDM